MGTISTLLAAGSVWAQVNRIPASEPYGRLRLSFEANQGQADRRVKFVARGSGYNLFLTGDGAVLSLRRKSAVVREAQAADAMLRMTLVDANADAAVQGTDPLPGRTNYFVGRDPARWQTNVPTYGAVRYAGVYPGIDLIYRGNQRLLEYDFIVAPGANPHSIDIRFLGARHLSVNREGALVIRLGESYLIEPAPVVYQDAGGRRQLVNARYELRGRERVGFRLANYDRGRPLVIDPVLVYSTYLGGNSRDNAESIAVDALGSVYVTGATFSSDFPTTSGAFQRTIAPSTFAAVVTKFSPDGSALLYSTYLGGADSFGTHIAVDSAGHAYVVGYTTSSGFPTTPGALQTTFRGGVKGFVTRLNPAGSALEYSTLLGGSVNDYAWGIAVDGQGNAYITGSTTSLDFPTTPGALQTKSASWEDAFVTKLSPAGALLYSTYLGGTNSDQADNIAIDSAGNAYVTGATFSYDFPTTAGAPQRTPGPSWYGYNFVAKLNSDASALVYSTYLGGGQGTPRPGIAVDTAGNAYVTSRATPDSGFRATGGAFQTQPWSTGPQFAAFVTKLNSTGWPIYSTYLGVGSSGNGIKVDAAGNAYVTGEAGTYGFPTTPGAFQTGGSSAAFVTVVNPAGSNLQYSTYLGGSGVSTATDIAIDEFGNAYVTGWTTSSDFPVTPGSYQGTYAGTTDSFITKMALGGTLDTTPPIITPEISGTLGNNGWYTSNVAVRWNVSDPESNIVSSSSGCDGRVVQEETPGVTMSCWATNRAGLFNSAEVVIKIDKTPPLISGMPIPSCTLWPPNHKLIRVATVAATDALSGITPGTFTVTGTSNEPIDPSDPAIVITPNGSGGLVVQLQADRLGTGNGRVYTLSATTSDLAGNRTATTATCTVPHDQGK